MTIQVEDYFRDSVDNWGFTPQEADTDAADNLLVRVNAMFDEALQMDAALSSGHRTPAKTDELRKEGYGAVHNDAHEHATGVDVADPLGAADKAITDEMLTQYGLYREDPRWTVGWVHLQTNAPGSGHHTFIP